MHNHRIVPAGLSLLNYKKGHKKCLYKVNDTIPCPSDWTAEELVALAAWGEKDWLKIGSEHLLSGKSLIEIIREILTLAASGLTVEEIKKLNEVKK